MKNFIMYFIVMINMQTPAIRELFFSTNGIATTLSKVKAYWLVSQ